MDKGGESNGIKEVVCESETGLSGEYVDKESSESSQTLSSSTILQTEQKETDNTSKRVRREIRPFADLLEDYKVKGLSPDLLLDMYEFIEPHLVKLHLTTLLPSALDQDFARIFFSYFRVYYDLLIEGGPNFWDHLKMQPDARQFEEVSLIRRRIGTFRAQWRALYKNRKKIKISVN